MVLHESKTSVKKKDLSIVWLLLTIFHVSGLTNIKSNFAVKTVCHTTLMYTVEHHYDTTGYKAILDRVSTTENKASKVV